MGCRADKCRVRMWKRRRGTDSELPSHVQRVECGKGGKNQTERVNIGVVVSKVYRSDSGRFPDKSAKRHPPRDRRGVPKTGGKGTISLLEI